MEGINNATRRLIVTNFYRNHQAKGKPYTVEYFRKLNVTRRQVYRAIERFESGISHKQQLGAGRPKTLSTFSSRQTRDLTPRSIDQQIANGWPTTLCHITSIILAWIFFSGRIWLLFNASLNYLLIFYTYTKYSYIEPCFSSVFQMLWR